MTLESSTKWRRIIVENVHTFPVNQQGFQVRDLWWAATNACNLKHGIHLDCKENVFANPRSTLGSLQIPCQGTHPFMTSTAAGEAPALISTGRPVAKEDERKGSTIPMPTFARMPTTMNSSVPVDIPQSSMVGQRRQQVSEIQFDKFPTPSSSCAGR